MEILIPEPRTPPARRSWIPAAILCVPPLLAWALIALDLTGAWRTLGATLIEIPPAVQAAVMLGSPAAAALIGGLALRRRMQAGQPLDRRLLALAATGAILVLVTASAAWATGS